MNVLGICSSSAVLNVIFIVKQVIMIISVVVPITLLIIVMVDFMKAVNAGDQDGLKKASDIAVKRSIACVIIFMIPTFVNVLTRVSPGNSEYKTCMESATMEYISQRRAEEKEAERLSIEAYKAANQEKADDYAESHPENNGNNGGNNPGTSGNGDSSNYKDGSTVTTNNIVTINTTDIGCTLYYSDHSTVFKTLSVNSEISSQMHGILTNLCTYKNQNSDIIPRLETAGAYVGKSGYHGKGLAIDLFNLWEFKMNGKTYTPYALYGGTSGELAWTRYNDFVCEVCNGQENCKYNINYVIYEQYFKNNGWCWGGNWGTNYFDPMHYELTNGPCSTSNKRKISC